MDEPQMTEMEYQPGAFLLSKREERGYSVEYVAARLNLRTRVIELLEADNYEALPEAVFIKGYIRAYARLLDLDSKPLIEAYKLLCGPEKKTEKALWQPHREGNRFQTLIRWGSVAVAAGIMLCVALWWHKAKELNTMPIIEQAEQQDETPVSSYKLTDISRMQTILSSGESMTDLEKKRG